MVSTGSGNTSVGYCAAVGDGSDDLYQSVWSGSAWAVDVDGGSPSCGEAYVEDRHDPGIIPLPDDEFKMYVWDHDTAPVVMYWNDDLGVWEDETTFEIWLDDGFTTEVTACAKNLDVVVHVDPPVVREQMFFRAVREFDSTGCFVGAEWAMGVLSAERVQ